jgi:hypothetical protein
LFFLKEERGTRMTTKFEKKLANLLLTSLPKCIVDIILGYLRIDPRERYKEKYLGVCEYVGDCQGYNHFTMDCPKKQITCNVESVPKNEACTNCGTHVTYRPVDYFKIDYCDKCQGQDCRITTYGYCQDKIETPNNLMDFDACVNCSLIGPCSKATADDHVCLLNLYCVLCQDNICSDGVHGCAWSQNGICLCIDCGNYSLLGRNLVEEISTKLPPTYPEFINIFKNSLLKK